MLKLKNQESFFKRNPSFHSTFVRLLIRAKYRKVTTFLFIRTSGTYIVLLIAAKSICLIMPFPGTFKQSTFQTLKINDKLKRKNYFTGLLWNFFISYRGDQQVKQSRIINCLWILKRSEKDPFFKEIDVFCVKKSVRINFLYYFAVCKHWSLNYFLNLTFHNEFLPKEN